MSLVEFYNSYGSIIRPLVYAACSWGAMRFIYRYATKSPFSNWDLQNKVIVITGASQGIGRALAIQLHKQGAKLILAARSIDKLKELAAELTSSNPTNQNTPECFYLDLAAPNGFTELINLSPTGQVDILINNAGIATHSSCADTTMATHRTSMDINYFGQIQVTQALLPYMPKGSSVITVSSVQGKFAIPNRSAYGASKHAILAYMDALRAELSTHLHVLVVCPGYVSTNLSVNALTGKGDRLNDTQDPHLKHAMSPEYLAERIIQGLVHRENELVVVPDAAPKAAFWLRVLLPDLYFLVMAKRASKETKQQ